MITGLSGSGKSSLAFDTIYAEGQRRYVESLSAYARQFLGQMDKPDVDSIEGLSPAISIDQRLTNRNPRSTVGTITEIYDYLRLLYARVGEPHCPNCGNPISRQSVQQIVDQLLLLPEGTRLQILVPVIRGRKGEHRKVLESIRKDGFIRIRVNGELHEVTDELNLDKNKKHTIEIVVDRIIIRSNIATRLTDSIETALRYGSGIVVVDVIDQEEQLFSENFACPDCGISMEELTPRMFSFNSPYGACPACDGLGRKLELDPDLILDRDLSINAGALIPWRSSKSQWLEAILGALCREYGIDPDQPVKMLTPESAELLLYGAEKPVKFEYTNRHGRKRIYEAVYEGLIPYLNRRYRESSSEWVRQDLEQYMSERECTACQGRRLRPEVLGVTVGGLNIMEVSAPSVCDSLDFFESWNWRRGITRLPARFSKRFENG